MELRWGILGTGLIARRFAQGLQPLPGQRLHAVGSRTLEAARSLTEETSGLGYDSYAAVLEDPLVDVVYIALPHHLHSEWTIRAARAGKHVLCEKPFALSAEEAEQALDLVRRCDVFFMEAFMVRCHPQTRELKRLVGSGAVGRLTRVHAEFGFRASDEWQNFRTDPALGGGALMDVGCYCVSMIRWVAGEEPVAASYQAELAPRGYDAHGEGRLTFASGLEATMRTGMHGEYQNRVEIVGEAGRIDVPSPWFCDAPLRIEDARGVREVRIGEELDLYGNEAAVVGEFVEERECPYVTWIDTLANMRALDMMRASASSSGPLSAPPPPSAPI